MPKRLFSACAVLTLFAMLIAGSANAEDGETTTTTLAEGRLSPSPIAREVPEAVTPTTLEGATTTAPAEVVLPDSSTTAVLPTTTIVAVEFQPTTTVEVRIDPELDAFQHQSARMYRTALGREADAAGRDFWADRLREGFPIEEIARGMLASDEAMLSTGDPIIDAYRWALNREPDDAGYDYWASFKDPAIAVAFVSDSREHQLLTKTQPPPARAAVAASAADDYPPGWVDGGNGVWMPKILISIRFCESRHDYSAQNSRSTASGAYQFLNSSWAAYGHADRFGVSRAKHATPAQQDAAAVLTWERDGTRPWYASRHCWG